MNIVKKILNAKKIGVILSILVATTFGSAKLTNAVVSPIQYQVWLPAYMGIAHTGWGNNWDGGSQGENCLYSLSNTGTGSYALSYYLVNSNEQQRGAYKTIDENHYQYFSLFTSSLSYSSLYRLRMMNYSSVSALVLADGDWGMGHFYLRSGSNPSPEN